MYGETLIKILLNRYIEKNGGYAVNDVIIPIGQGKTAQIDHILFSKYGIFVIETKNLSGLLFGNDTAYYWSQNIYGDKYKVYNPVLQNKKHVELISNILGINEHIHNVVVLIQNNNKKLNSTHVIRSLDLLNYLDSFKNGVFIDQEVSGFYEKINYYKTENPCSKQEHASYVRKCKRK